MNGRAFNFEDICSSTRNLGLYTVSLRNRYVTHVNLDTKPSHLFQPATSKNWEWPNVMRATYVGKHSKKVLICICVYMGSESMAWRVDIEVKLLDLLSQLRRYCKQMFQKRMEDVASTVQRRPAKSDENTARK